MLEPEKKVFENYLDGPQLSRRSLSLRPGGTQLLRAGGCGGGALAVLGARGGRLLERLGRDERVSMNVLDSHVRFGKWQVHRS